MKLLFKQRIFSWLDSYDIYNEAGDVVYTVEGKLAWGHCFKVLDNLGKEVGAIKEKIITLLPEFEIYEKNRCLGSISREFTFFKPKYNIDFKGWTIEGDFFEWDYNVLNQNGKLVATVSKELFKWTDTYVIDIVNSQDTLYVLMLVLAIDADKCSRQD